MSDNPQGFLAQLGLGIGALGALGAGAWSVFWRVKGRIKQDIRDSTIQGDFEAVHAKYRAAMEEVERLTAVRDTLQKDHIRLLSQHRRLIASTESIFATATMIAEMMMPLLDSDPTHAITARVIRRAKTAMEGIEEEFLRGEYADQQRREDIEG